MLQPISTLSPLSAATGVANAASTTPVDGPSFTRLLLDSIEQLNPIEHDAKGAVDALAGGGPLGPAEVFGAVQKAEIAFQMMMRVHAQLVEAYQQVQDIRV
jgi:flagellar hook-basal body complex protein FliE